MQRVNLFPNPRMTGTGKKPDPVDCTVAMNGDGSMTITNTNDTTGGYTCFKLSLTPGARLHAHSVSTFTAAATNMRGALMGIRATTASSVITETGNTGVKGDNPNDLDFTVPSDGGVTIEFRCDMLVDNVRVSQVIIEDQATWTQAKKQAGGRGIRSGSPEPQDPSNSMGGR